MKCLTSRSCIHRGDVSVPRTSAGLWHMQRGAFLLLHLGCSFQCHAHRCCLAYSSGKYGKRTRSLCIRVGPSRWEIQTYSQSSHPEWKGLLDQLPCLVGGQILIRTIVCRGILSSSNTTTRKPFGLFTRIRETPLPPASSQFCPLGPPRESPRRSKGAQPVLGVDCVLDWLRLHDGVCAAPNSLLGQRPRGP